MTSPGALPPAQQGARLGEPRWPMAVAVVATGLLRAALPHELRNGDAAWLFLVLVVGLLAVLIIGDPGRIDRDRRWLHNLTSVLIGLISVANADAAIRLVIGIIDVSSFTQDAKVLLASGAAIWLSNIITFALWYWNLDRGGPAARAAGRDVRPALIFPEMLHTQHVREDWSPSFVDYFHFAFATATAFSPTDVSAVKPWMKLMMMAEEAISLVVAILVVARAVNILK
ncbi:MAG TPA: hypothetical protein VH012_03555 [Acidimicrobiales bacterium]|jgi:hypothetical protein|nr:hypothetical protein [Acidimicrobiales bacterium]